MLGKINNSLALKVSVKIYRKLLNVGLLAVYLQNRALPEVGAKSEVLYSQHESSTPAFARQARAL